MICYCLTDALRIGRLPEDQWLKQIRALPTACNKADCTAGGCCQTVVRDYLDAQRRCLEAKTHARVSREREAERARMPGRSGRKQSA